MSWLEETHGTRFELLRHFLGRFFENEMASDTDEVRKAVTGIFALFVSFGIAVLQSYRVRYDGLQSSAHSTFALYRHELRSDQLLFIGIAMGVTVLLTVLHWESLFPSKRDCLALASLPIRPRSIFAAKAVVLLIVFTGFVLAANLPWAIFFATASSGQWQENPSGLVNTAAGFAATAGACIFVFFSLVALQGLLLNILPARLFPRISLWTQGLILVATIGALPLAGRQPAAAWWPGTWFLGLWEAIITGHARLSFPALAAMSIPALIAAAAYLASYGQYRRILLEATGGTSAGRWAGVGSWLLERWIRNPREQGAFAFLGKSLARSNTHRLVLLTYAGFALGWVVFGALDMRVPSLRDGGVYGTLVTVSPLSFALLVTLALRYLFSLPATLQANWIFRVLDREGRAAWLSAVERFVVWLGIAPVYLVSLPSAIAILGVMRACAVTLLSFFVALLWFELIFRNWRKLGFTCSYLPEQRPAAITAVRWFLAIPTLLILGVTILYCSSEPAAFVALVTLQIAIVWRQRRKRLANWQECELIYEDLPAAEIVPLDLGVYIHAEGPESHAVTEKDTFSGTLSASRSILPGTWAEELHEARKEPFFASLFDDLRLGLRLIRRNPLSSVMIVATLTLGIGINASVYSVIDAIALRPHVERDPASFIHIIPESQSTLRPRIVSATEYAAYRQARSLRQLVAFGMLDAVVGDTGANRVSLLGVSCNFFSLDGPVRPILGRPLVESDCRSSEQSAVAVLSEGTWRSYFGGDRQVVGKTIHLDDKPFTVAGVIPDNTGAWTNLTAGVWIPYSSAPLLNTSFDDDTLWLWLSGRLARGVTAAQARLELILLSRQQDRRVPGRITTIATTNGSLIQQMELSAEGRSLMLTGFFVGTFNLVLFIACANVSTLLLSRAVTRRREISIRLQLGAPRLRLARMLLTESLLLAALAGGVSVWLVGFVPAPLARAIFTAASDFPMAPDWSTFAYIGAAVLITGTLAGLTPAFESMGTTSRATSRRVLGGLVSLQIALSMVLLVTSGLLGLAENRNLRADPGYRPDRIVIAQLRFPKGTALDAIQLRLRAIAQRLQSLPGVHSTALTDDGPLFAPQTVELRPPMRRDAVQPVDIFPASPHFFETMGIPLVRGREFEPSDGASVIVSETLANVFWRRRDPLGQTVDLPTGPAVVVGIAKDVSPTRFGGTDNPVLYRVRGPNSLRNVISVRFDNGAHEGPSAVRAVLREIEPGMSVGPILLQAQIEKITAQLWNFVALILILALVGIALSSSGIYGTVSLAVNQGMRDLGIRLALGARRVDIILEVFISGGRPVVHGLIAGLWLSVASAAALRRVLGDLPLRIDTSDPLLYAGAALLLAAAALAAMAAPARRGAQSDPAVVLRYE